MDSCRYKSWPNSSRLVYQPLHGDKQLADSLSAMKSMEKSLRARPGDAPVSEDDKDREIQILTFEIQLAQIEIKDYQQNAGKSQKVLTDIEKQKQTLKRKLDIELTKNETVLQMTYLKCKRKAEH
ncbi:uncharacterized protein LOC135337065 [Halichondria panicea]|uniref:uncharacterized protein LOC135337065 n=1 Tax=Halichondria panicea TaxID=6063 RepID=UPI00312B7C8D